MAPTRVALIARRQEVSVDHLIAKLAEIGIDKSPYSTVEEADALRALGRGRGQAPPGVVRRRHLAVAVALLAAVVAAVGLWQLLSGGEHARPPRPPPPAPAVSPFALPRVGLQGRQPTTWRRAARGNRLELRSADGAMLLVFSSPTSGSFDKRVQSDAERALLDSYKPARVVTRLPARLGGARASTTEILATQRGRKIRILSITAANGRRTYLAALFSALPPPDNRLIEAQEILRSVKFTAPRG